MGVTRWGEDGGAAPGAWRSWPGALRGDQPSKAATGHQLPVRSAGAPIPPAHPSLLSDTESGLGPRERLCVALLRGVAGLRPPPIPTTPTGPRLFRRWPCRGYLGKPSPEEQELLEGQGGGTPRAAGPFWKGGTRMETGRPTQAAPGGGGGRGLTCPEGGCARKVGWVGCSWGAAAGAFHWPSLGWRSRPGTPAATRRWSHAAGWRCVGGSARGGQVSLGGGRRGPLPFLCVTPSPPPRSHGAQGPCWEGAQARAPWDGWGAWHRAGPPVSRLGLPVKGECAWVPCPHHVRGPGLGQVGPRGDFGHGRRPVPHRPFCGRSSRGGTVGGRSEGQLSPGPRAPGPGGPSLLASPAPTSPSPWGPPAPGWSSSLSSWPPSGFSVMAFWAPREGGSRGDGGSEEPSLSGGLGLSPEGRQRWVLREASALGPPERLRHLPSWGPSCLCGTLG